MGILGLLEAGKNCGSDQDGFVLIGETSVLPLRVNNISCNWEFRSVPLSSFFGGVNESRSALEEQPRLPEPGFGTKYQEKKGFDFSKRSGKGRHVLGDKER